jgi:uncharacterized protein DUF3592
MSEGELVSSLFVTAGMVAVYFVEKKIAADRRFLARAQPATGQVDATWFDTESDTGPSPRLLVKFTVAPDRPVFISIGGGEREGDIVDLVYDPENPEDARRKGSIGGEHIGFRVLIYAWMLLWLGVLLFWD